MNDLVGYIFGALLPVFVILYVFWTGLKVILKGIKFLSSRETEPGVSFQSSALQQSNSKEQMPKELTQGRLYLSESDISTDTPRPIHGRVDQVYEYKGALVPVDTKVRQSEVVYPSDVAQLSAYKVILENGLKRRVLPYGFIRLVVHGRHGRSVRYKKVDLFSEQEIIYMWEYLKTNGKS